MFKSLKNNNSSISPIKILNLSLASKIGVGSISGICLSIYKAGIGSIFWMMIISFFIIIISYVETYITTLYKVKNDKDYVGGVNYTLKYALNNHFLGSIYSVLTILGYSIGFIAIQANTISKIAFNYFNINYYITGIILFIIILIIVIKDIRFIADITNKMVPLMIIIYTILGIYVLINNINIIPDLFNNIIINSLNYKSFLYGLLPIIIISSERIIFASEIGIGTSSILSCVTDDLDIKKQSYIQMLGNYITCFLICGTTMIIVATSKYSINLTDINGIEIALLAFNYHFKGYGKILLSIMILLFSISTIITCCYFGENGLTYFNKKKYLILLKLICLINVFLGSINSPSFIWYTIDIVTGLLALINIYTIFKLRKKI